MFLRLFLPDMFQYWNDYVGTLNSYTLLFLIIHKASFQQYMEYEQRKHRAVWRH